MTLRAKNDTRARSGAENDIGTQPGAKNDIGAENNTTWSKK